MNYSAKFNLERSRSKKRVDFIDKQVRVEYDRGKQLVKSLYQTNDENVFIPSAAIKYFKHENYNVQAYEKHLSSNKRKQSTSNDRLSKINGMLSNIMSKHQQMKTKLRRLKHQKQNQEQQEIQNMSFTPQLSNNPRYQISSTMEQRNRSWQLIIQNRDQARAQHYTSIREEIVEKQYKQCTFSPKMIAKPKSNQILKIKIQNQRFKEKQKEKQNENPRVIQIFEKVNRNKQFVEEQKGMNYRNYNAIKSMIKLEMSRIKLGQ